MAFDLGDYKEVSERLVDLFVKHPEASMRGTYEIIEAGNVTYLAYRAECYRTPDDQAPGVGTAWEQVPGATTYTKGSELQNAETSAWGRAIVAVGASESKKVASADEVRTAQANQQAAEPRTALPATPERVDQIRADVLALEIQGWMKEQAFGWPWSVEECDYIEAKIASEREKLAHNNATAYASGPPDVQAAAVAALDESVMSRAESKTVDVLGDLAKFSEEPF